MEYPYIDIHTHNKVAEGVVTMPTLGIHPWDAEQHDLNNGEQKHAFEAAIDAVKAVGEIGLDFAAEVDREAQQAVFIAQLKIAKKHRKAVVLHCVKAFEPTMQLLSTFPLSAVIFHGFIGSAKQMNQAVERGYYISYGARTFSSPKTLIALRETPLENLLLETDTAPVAIEEIYAKISAHRMESVEELREAIYNNYQRILHK